MRIAITHQANEKAISWCIAARSSDASYLEIAGLLEGEAIKGGDIIVDDVHLLGVKPISQEIIPGGQTLSSGHVDIPASHVAAFYDEWIRSVRSPSRIIGWWHSHGSGKTFQSGQDRQTTIDRFKNRRFVAAITFNVLGERYGEVTIFDPFYHRIDDVSCKIDYPIVEVDLSAVKELVKKRTKVKMLSPKEAHQLYMKAAKKYPGYKGYKHTSEIYSNAGIAWDEDEDERAQILID